MIRSPDSRHNLHSVDASGHPLALVCNACGHRAALEHEKIDAHSGNMKLLRDLSFKCSKCGSGWNSMYLIYNAQELADFLAGKPEW